VPVPSVNNHSSSTDKTKSPLPITTKSVEKNLSLQEDIFNNEEEKELDSKPLETPRDERDTQHDALSISVLTDLPDESDADYDDARASIDNEK
jgi:hypothetical protein